MNRSILYPPENCIITFREPFPRKEFSPDKIYYIRARIDSMPEMEIRIVKEQQMEVMDELIAQDKKLTCARVACIDGEFIVVSRSPQSDFLEMIR